MTLQLSIVVPHANMVAASAANGNDYDTKMVLWNETRVVKRSLTANTTTSRIVEDGNSLLYLCEYVYAARVYTLHFSASDLFLQEAMNNDKLYVLPSSFCVSPPTIGFHSRNIMHFLCTCSANYKHSAAVNSVLATHFLFILFRSFFNGKTFYFPFGPNVLL